MRGTKMKVIFSRKGWDSEFGGKPSPIFEDGAMLSMPIPRENESIKYSDLSYKGMPIEKIIQDLHPEFKNSSRYSDTCHADPAIDKELYSNIDGWKPASGHRGTAGTHLDNQDISVGDIILFFGRFQKVKEVEGKLEFDDQEQDIHAIYGYMQIGQILNDQEEIKRSYPWHPHAQEGYLKDSKNRLYIPEQNRCAVFNYSEPLRLTKPQDKKDWNLTEWKLPKFFLHPEVEISYHPNKNQDIKPFDDHAVLATMAKGQEFVVTVPDELQDELSAWVEGIIKAGTRG